MADLVAPVMLSDGWFGPSVNRQMWQMEADAVLPFSAPSGSARVSCVCFTWEPPLLCPFIVLCNS